MVCLPRTKVTNTTNTKTTGTLHESASLNKNSYSTNMLYAVKTKTKKTTPILTSAKLFLLDEHFYSEQ